ncbi:CTTN [Bugula neritina]|uniref:CTTN n=1 Tax=Bugula neritina TaxID=10212 RepID=A0A7J7K896_BUGNE|nr:CTTN [Bugula neritina]
MWRAAAGNTVNVAVSDEDDDWETDPDFQNDVSEKEQRWGSKTVEGSGHQSAIDLKELRGEVQKDDAKYKEKELKEKGTGSYGYGGKFGVQKDRMDKAAVGHDHQEKVAQHASVTDTSKGFGGKFGVQKDRVDKSAARYSYIGTTEKHSSQKDYSSGFGGKYGVQTDRKDQLQQFCGWLEYQEKLAQHKSQKDYSTGFGGRYGVQTDELIRVQKGGPIRER